MSDTLTPFLLTPSEQGPYSWQPPEGEAVTAIGSQQARWRDCALVQSDDAVWRLGGEESWLAMLSGAGAERSIVLDDGRLFLCRRELASYEVCGPQGCGPYARWTMQGEQWQGRPQVAATEMPGLQRLMLMSALAIATDAGR